MGVGGGAGGREPEVEGFRGGWGEVGDVEVGGEVGGEGEES